ncbi:hypothetical protein ACQP1W_18780 [Spirillospora sp. CA-255316]
MRFGLWVPDAFRLGFDCIVSHAESASYLRCFNHKMKRGALVPIDGEFERMVGDQQRRLLEGWPTGTPTLFPPDHPGGQGPRGEQRLVEMIRTVLNNLDAIITTLDNEDRDQHGRPMPADNSHT